VIVAVYLAVVTIIMCVVPYEEPVVFTLVDEPQITSYWLRITYVDDIQAYTNERGCEIGKNFIESNPVGKKLPPMKRVVECLPVYEGEE